jgi:hypothetical protein
MNTPAMIAHHRFRLVRTLLAGLFLMILVLPSPWLGRNLPLGVEGCQAGESAINIQAINLQSGIDGNGILTAFQSNTGFQILENSYKSFLNTNFYNTVVAGMLNINQSSGIGINQAGVIRWDFAANNPEPTLLAPQSVMAIQNLSNNVLKNTIGSNYLVTIGGQRFLGSGVMVINQAAGHLNNQLTTIGVSVGSHLPATRQPVGYTITDLEGGGVIVAVSNNQLQSIVTVQNNQIEPAKSQTATAMVEKGALRDFSGICAISQVAGDGNQVMNNLRVNVNLPR